MEALSAPQKRMLEFIEKYISKNSTAPSYKIIGKALGYAGDSSVQHHIGALIRKGYLTKERYLSTGLEIKNTSNHLPILGKVAAGRPIDYKSHNEQIEVPIFMRKGTGNHFVLEISGDSMINEGILDSDYVIVREQQTANNGDIVVAEIDNEATIKRFFKKRSQIELHSANEKYKPIIIREDDEFKIAGIYCGLLRR